MEKIKERLQELAPSSQELVITNLYEHITLTDEETAEALRYARQTKHYAIEHAKYVDKVYAEQKWDRPSPREYWEALLRTRSQKGTPFQITEWNKDVLMALCLYFAGDKRFEEKGESFSLEKGIMISGNPGTGKSHLMDFFKKNPHQSYTIITCKTVAENYRTGWKRDDMEALDYYSRAMKAPAGHAWDQKELGFCFSDLGTEDEKKNFGNSQNVMEHIIFQRYEGHLPFNQTHFTTNLNPQEVEDYYGLRIRDRLKEMCNKLVLDGPSFR
jgi:DNA replication protein DnaC